MVHQAGMVQILHIVVQSGYFEEDDVTLLRRYLLRHLLEGLRLLRKTSDVWSCRFSMPVFNLCVAVLAGAALAHLAAQEPREGPDDAAPVAVKFCLEVLGQTQDSFPLSAALQKSIVEKALEQGVFHPNELQDIIEPLRQISTENIVDAFDRFSHSQLLPELRHFINPSIANEWPAAWSRYSINQLLRRVGMDSDVPWPL